MTANKTILVSSFSRYIYKVVQKGILHPFFYCICSASHHCISENESYDVSVLAGSGQEGEEDGKALECSFSGPKGLVVDEPTHLCYVADWGNNMIRKISFAD